MFRLLIWIFIIYVFFKVAKAVMRILNPTRETREQVRDDQGSDNKRKPYSIDQKDIVDAKFEEIKEDKDKKTGE